MDIFEIERPFLIQRASFRKDVKKDPSIDETLSFDYMGSSEYEFGALPKSLKIICKNFSDYIIVESPIIRNYKQKILFYLCHKNQNIEEFEKYLVQIINSQIRCKESTYLDSHVSGKMLGRPISSHFENLDVWWDIENNIFFTFGLDKIKLIENAIKNTIIKKRMSDDIKNIFIKKE